MLLNDFTIRELKNKEADLVENKLVEYNLSKVPLKQENSFLWINKVIENENGEIVAGIISKMCWKCLYIDVLWVDEKQRGKGLGTKLMMEVEKVSKEKGCHLIHLDTFDFQARDFYFKLGYEVFGELEDCPQNHKRYFMKKII